MAREHASSLPSAGTVVVYRGRGHKSGEVWVPDLKSHPTFLADLIADAKAHINTLTPAQIALNKALEDLDNWKQSCEEAVYASDLNHLTETLKLDKEHTYYQNMRQAMLARAKVLGCTFDIPRDTWIEPPEFNGISEALRDELQAFIDQCGLDVKTACEYLGIDSLMEIDSTQVQKVMKELEELAKSGISQ